MANEAFALSPMSARAASPSDADFDAIREAFLETSRGRWFLDEYTRRNRNADTAMVLEAVARIESSLATQKEEQRQAATEPAGIEPPESELTSSALPDAMAAVQAIVAAARENALTALAGPMLDDALAPSRKCARVIREIAWGLRESGADGRICALLESQVDAINTACDHVTAGGLRDEILRAFDQATQQIDAIAPSAKLPLAEPLATVHATHLDPGPAELFENAQDIAVQHIVADELPLEMAVAPDASTPERMTAPVAISDEEAPIELAAGAAAMDVVTDIVAVEPDAGYGEPPIALTIELDSQPVAESVSEPIVAASVSTLGESLIANGIIAKPIAPRGDPLAPIRRMSQAEKIAFFS